MHKGNIGKDVLIVNSNDTYLLYMNLDMGSTCFRGLLFMEFARTKIWVSGGRLAQLSFLPRVFEGICCYKNVVSKSASGFKYFTRHGSENETLVRNRPELKLKQDAKSL